MAFSPEHTAAVLQACRLPALAARLGLLAISPELPTRAEIAFYGTAWPLAEPGDEPGAAPLVMMEMSARAGVVSAEEYQVLIDTPLESLVVGADAENGTIPRWARVTGPLGDWWGDFTVSVEGEGGDIQFPPTGIESGEPVVRWFNGAPARVAAFVIQG